MPDKSKYRQFLEDPDIRRWYENLEARSVITAGVYLRTLGYYCKLEKTTPKGILKGAGSKEFRDQFADFVRRLEREGKAGSYIARFKKVLISWMQYNGLDVKIKINIKGENDTPTIKNERVPDKPELAKIFRMSSPRGRVSASLMACSGIRPESLGDYEGTDGITLADMPELDLAEIRFTKLPAILMIRPNLSKARHQYFTFIGREAGQYIEDYLQKRAKAGEKLTPEVSLLGFDPKGPRQNKFLRTCLVTRDIKEAIIKAGFTWRPYVLRGYCDTGMIIAESKGVISHPYLQFLMGHKGDIEARYSTNKGKLSPDMVEDMRAAYGRCEQYLSTSTLQMDTGQMERQIAKQIMLFAGFEESEINKMDIDNLSDAEIQNIVRQRLLGVLENNGSRQKVIPLTQVEEMIGQGWEYVNTLPNDRAIMKLPSL
ncbi:MAG: site-specific integrase [Thaumarchaeota archaeon]|nr:site-specific integrase [Nitrososphaerota archaeon]